MAKKGKGKKYLGKGILGKTPKALKPVKKKKLAKQAMKTMSDIFAPGYADLNAQEQTLKSVAEKRASDNKYYLDWLRTQTDQLGAHSRAADQQVQANQQQIQDSAEQALSGMRDQLVTQAGQHSDTVSNPAHASSFNTLPEAQRSLAMIGAERQRTSEQAQSSERSRQVAGASNFAQAAAAEARRVSDLWSGLKDVGSAKQKLKLEQAAETSKEVARLLDREIEKAGTRMELRGTAAGLALEKRRLNLDKFLAQFEAKQANADREDEQAHERSENRKDRKADAKGDKEGGEKHKGKAKAANHAAKDIIKEFGPKKANQNFNAFVDKIMEQSGSGYEAARRAAKQAIKRARGGGGKGGKGDSGTGENPNAELND